MRKNKRKRIADIAQALGLGFLAAAFFRSEVVGVLRAIFIAAGIACIIASVVLTDEDDEDGSS